MYFCNVFQNQCHMTNRIEKNYNGVCVVQRSDYKWGVVDNDGNEIVPLGTYDWIDSFDQGLARVKIGKTASPIKNCSNKWGIINTLGEVVLPVEYDNIWNFAGKNRFSTRTTKGDVDQEVYLHDLNPNLPIRGIKHRTDEYDYEPKDDYGSHYGEFVGSYAQDVMGYSDDVINDAFDGDPDAYWSID